MLREEFAALHAEREAFLEEREATDTLVAAFEQYVTRKRIADAATKAVGERDAIGSADLGTAPADRSVERPTERSTGHQDAPVPPTTDVEGRTAPECAEATTPDEEREEVVVFRLPVTLLASVDRMISACQFASRDEFARTVFAEALEARFCSTDEQRSSARTRAGRKVMKSGRGVHLPGAERDLGSAAPPLSADMPSTAEPSG